MPNNDWFDLIGADKLDPAEKARLDRDARIEREITRRHAERLTELRREAVKAGFPEHEFRRFMDENVGLTPESYPLLDREGKQYHTTRLPMSRRDALTRELRALKSRLIAEAEGRDGPLPFDGDGPTEFKSMPGFGYGIKASPATGHITGYLAAFNNVDAYGDVIAPGAFKASLAKQARFGRPTPILWQHDPSKPIGKWTNLREDARGLHGTGMIDASIPDGHRALSGIRNGYVRGLSIGYKTDSEGTDRRGNRLLKAISLMEASVVTFPANSDAIIETVD